MSSSGTNDFVGYVPIPSVGHEIGIIFGFGGLMFICMVTYLIIWKRYQKKIAKIEEERRAALARTDLYNDEKYDEKGNLRGRSERMEVAN